MAQLLLVLLIVAVAIGIYRCNGPGEGESAPAPPLEQTLQAPKNVESEVNRQVDIINQKNRETLNRY